MSEYLIGAGAVLTAGPTSSIVGASLHAQTDPLIAERIAAAMIDFEAPSADELSRIVLVAAGWTRPRFETEVVRPLLARRECTLAGVLAELARATGSAEVHVFARWLPSEALAAELAAAGIGIVAHPLEAIDRAALIQAGRLTRWTAPFRAA